MSMTVTSTTPEMSMTATSTTTERYTTTTTTRTTTRTSTEMYISTMTTAEMYTTETTITTTVDHTHEVTGSFSMAVSSAVHDLDEAGQETFVNLIADSIAHLLGISADYVAVIVHNFLDDR